MKKMTEAEVINLIDSLRDCGKAAREEFKRLCRERGLDDNAYFIKDYTKVHLKVAQEVHDRWHTTNKFKVGDKVHVVPLTCTPFPNCIRATVTEIPNDGHGYRLRAFESDLPGIYMFNIWDKDLEPRVGKKQKPVPAEFLIFREK